MEKTLECLWTLLKQSSHSFLLSLPSTAVFYALYVPPTLLIPEFYVIWSGLAAAPAIAVNFYLQKVRVFKPKAGNGKKEFAGFTVSVIVRTVLENIALLVIVEQYRTDAILTQYSIATISAIFGFLIEKFFVFRSQ